MAQLRLQLSTKLSYSREGYLLHQGVSEIFTQCRARCCADGFSSSYIVGEPRFGKTHLAVALAEELSSHGRYPHLVPGPEIENWFREHSSATKLTPDEPVIIDDLQVYLDTIQPGGSGPFVSLVEALRHRNVPLVLISGRELEDFPADDHVKSRLRAAVGSRIGHPVEPDIQSLIERVARQRGLKLDQRKLQFLLRRVRRDIPSIEEYVEKVRYLADALGKPVRFPVLGDAL